VSRVSTRTQSFGAPGDANSNMQEETATYCKPFHRARDEPPGFLIPFSCRALSGRAILCGRRGVEIFCRVARAVIGCPPAYRAPPVRGQD
jgi:hypothetical protein